jgi:hypothetical protein
MISVTQAWKPLGERNIVIVLTPMKRTRARRGMTTRILMKRKGTKREIIIPIPIKRTRTRRRQTIT